MAEQEPLVDPGVPHAVAGGLYERYVDSEGVIHAAAWLYAANYRSAVGKCRQCGGDMFAEKPHEKEHPDSKNVNRDFEAQCGSCRNILVAPRGRVYKSALASGPGKRPPASKPKPPKERKAK